jgi:2-dehydro-3-deoxygalactonokinase
VTGPAAFAAVDWGTTRFRAWLLDVAGAVLAERRSDEGMISLEREKYEEVLEGHLAAIGVGPSLPVVICGMAGSRQGWIEAPYADAPAPLAEVFGKAVAVPGTRRDVRIVPGIAQRDPVRPDVMRGEETQLAGITSFAGGGDLLVCMPGTHCKWVELSGGAVIGFTTWMTGELFSVLSQHSILRHAVGREPARVAADDPVFGAWLDDALARPEDAVSRLFRIRASTLLAGMQPGQAAAALSGLLIGSEVGSARGRFGSRSEVILVGAGPLGALYAEALRRAGYAPKTVDAEEAVRRGLGEAARAIFGMDADRRAKS